ncbi:hypothetical protein ACO0QE_002420 [Hanseniaspora vineae]
MFTFTKKDIRKFDKMQQQRKKKDEVDLELHDLENQLHSTRHTNAGDRQLTQKTLSSQNTLQATEHDSPYGPMFISTYWNKYLKQKRLTIFYAMIALAFFTYFSITFIWQTHNSPVSLTHQASVSPSKRFGIESLFNGDFAVHHKPFKFIRAPPDSVRHVEDPGMFYTLESAGGKEEGNGNQKILVRNMFDLQWSEEIAETHFTYNNIRYKTRGLEISYNLDKMLVMTNKTSLFRHSKTALFWVKDLKENTYTPLSEKLLRNAQFSSCFNFISTVDLNYNIQIYPVYGGNPLRPMDITTDGKNKAVLNGIADWVYQEEIFGTDSTIWWSPQDDQFVYMKTFEHGVEVYSYPMYIEDYHDAQEFNYPRPGGKIPEYELHVVSMFTGKVYVLDKYQHQEELVYDVHWVDSDRVIVKKADRVSNELRYMLHSFNHTSSQWEKSIFNYLDFDQTYNGWVEKQQPMLNIPIYGSAHSDLLDIGIADIRPDSNGFNHVFYTPSIDEPTRFVQLTKGDFEVQQLLGFDKDTNQIFFTSNSKHPMAKHLYAVSILDFDDEGIQDLQEGNDMMEYNDFELSQSCRWGLRKILGPEVPKGWAGPITKIVTAAGMENFDGDGFPLSDTSQIENTLGEKYTLPAVNYKSIEIEKNANTLENNNDESLVTIHYKEYLPPGFDPQSKQKHPILVHVYGGPGSVAFTTQFDVFFESAVSSSFNAIVLEIEPRGTGNKGWEFRQYANNHIGYWEPRDIQSVVKKYIAKNEKKIDTERVAVWGWSYGGFSTLKTLEHDKGQIFKYGMAVAPVTNWSYYDAIYSERYLGLPGSSYDDAVIADIDSFKQVRRFLLMTGTADDNVHVFNTYKLLDKLNVGGVTNYDMQIFPDSDHSIAFHNSSKVIYSKLFSWLQNAFSEKFDAFA